MAVVLIGALATLCIAGVAAAVLLTRTHEPAIEVHPLAELVLAELPGQNCGACGNTNCLAAAEAIAAGTASADTCLAGAVETAERVVVVLRDERSRAESDGDGRS